MDQQKPTQNFLEEFKDNLVDGSVPKHRDASSSSHDSSEPRAKVVSVKHSFLYSLPEGPKLQYLHGTKITRSSGRRRTGTVVPRAEILGDLRKVDHSPK